MTTDNVIRVSRLPDRLIVDLMHELAEHFDEGTYHYKIFGNTRIDLEEIESLQELENLFNIAEATFSSNPSDIILTFRRGISKADFNQREPSAHFDEIKIARSGQANPQPLKLIEAAAIVHRTVNPIQTLESPQVSLEVSEFIKANYAQLTALISAMGTRFDERELLLERRREELEQKYLDDKAALFEEHQALLAKISEKQEELNKAREELDDRDNMHVRRELREKITADLKSRLQRPLVSASNAKIRYTVVLICIAASSILFLITWYSQQQIGNFADNVERWSIAAKMIVSGAAGVGFLVYALAWLRKVYLEDVQMERSLERYALDIDRASWTIETLIEMSKTDGAEIPSDWVKGACNDLFVASAVKDDAGGLQAFAALMDVAASAEVGTNGAKITLNRRGVRKLAQQAE